MSKGGVLFGRFSGFFTKRVVEKKQQNILYKIVYTITNYILI